MSQISRDELSLMKRKKVIVIAEAGVNHNGDLEIARKLIDAAADAGSDFVKFQTFKTENLVSAHAEKAAYQKENSGGGSQFEMLKKLELSEENHRELIAHCKLREIKFLSTAFDLDSISLLKKLGIKIFKIPSGEITNLPYLEKIGKQKSKVILSTGMSTEKEIEKAMKALVKSGTKKSDITILHCTTEYPAPLNEVNLLAMKSLHKKFKTDVGYSDHTQGIEVAIAAAALGASVIEKHFTLDRNMEGPDHKASLEPNELKEMIHCIRNIEIALGVGKKIPSKSELKNISAARKSIHTSREIKSGEKISENDLVMKRPGDGISPMKIKSVLGRKAKRTLPAEYKLTLKDF